MPTTKKLLTLMLVSAAPAPVLGGGDADRLSSRSDSLSGLPPGRPASYASVLAAGVVAQSAPNPGTPRSPGGNYIPVTVTKGHKASSERHGVATSDGWFAGCRRAVRHKHNAAPRSPPPHPHPPHIPPPTPNPPPPPHPTPPNPTSNHITLSTTSLTNVQASSVAGSPSMFQGTGDCYASPHPESGSVTGRKLSFRSLLGRSGNSASKVGCSWSRQQGQHRSDCPASTHPHPRSHRAPRCLAPHPPGAWHTRAWTSARGAPLGARAPGPRPAPTN